VLIPSAPLIQVCSFGLAFSPEVLLPRVQTETAAYFFFVDSLTVLPGLRLTVDCFTNRPVTAKRPLLPPELLPLDIDSFPFYPASCAGCR
jgi:hypothetical protein